MFLLSMQTGLIDMKLPQRYSIVKDSNADLGVIFSIVQIGPLSRLSALKFQNCFLHTWQYFDISEKK